MPVEWFASHALQDAVRRPECRLRMWCVHGGIRTRQLSRAERADHRLHGAPVATALGRFPLARHHRQRARREGVAADTGQRPRGVRRRTHHARPDNWQRIGRCRDSLAGHAGPVHTNARGRLAALRLHDAWTRSSPALSRCCSSGRDCRGSGCGTLWAIGGRRGRRLHLSPARDEDRIAARSHEPRRERRRVVELTTTLADARLHAPDGRISAARAVHRRWRLGRYPRLRSR